MQVDLDIKGTQNSLRQDFIELQQQSFPWSVNGSDGLQNGPVTLQVGPAACVLTRTAAPPQCTALQAVGAFRSQSRRWQLCEGHVSALA